jgi:hypothetical protein
VKSVFQVRVELRERGTSYPIRETVLVIARDITKASERAERHTRWIYKRRSVPIVALRTVAVELIGQAIT